MNGIAAVAAIAVAFVAGFALAHWLRWRDGRAQRDRALDELERIWRQRDRKPDPIIDLVLKTRPGAPKGARADITNSREGRG